MRILYFDIDLVIFISWFGEWVLFLGDYLGEFINEFDDEDYIMIFVLGGLKNYVY